MPHKPPPKTNRAAKNSPHHESEEFLAPRPEIGARLRLDVNDMALEGDPLARHRGYVLFVPGAIPGEEVQAEVVHAGRKFGRVRVLEVLRPSPHRVAPPCQYFGRCGGCTWQHIAYEEQLRLKERMLGSFLEQTLGVRIPIEPSLGLDEPWGFRNKVHFVVGRDRRGQTSLGHYGGGSRDFIPVEECRVHSDRGNQAAFRLRDLLRDHEVQACVNENPGTGVARHVIARASQSSGDVQLTLVATKRKFPGMDELAQEIVSGPSCVSSLHLNTNTRTGNLVLGSFTRRLAGRERLLEEIAGVRFLISPISFFQTSIRVAEKLVDAVLREVDRPGIETVLDLYAGLGLFALPLAKRGRRVLAIEENPFAVDDGIATAQFNRIQGCQFKRGRVETELRRVAQRGEFEAVILDPPREGCPEGVLWELSRRLRPQRIVYVSCDPRALVRDLRILFRFGYRFDSIRPVDMFPHTAHIEAVVSLRLFDDPHRPVSPDLERRGRGPRSPRPWKERRR